LNVMSGQRYKELSDQTIQYAIGLWGEVESDSFDPNVKDVILSSPKAKKLKGWTPPELSLTEIREKFGGQSVSDDDLILRYLGGNEQFEALFQNPQKYSTTLNRDQSPLTSSTSSSTSETLQKADVLSLIDRLSQKSDIDSVSIKTRDLKLSLFH